MSAVESVSVCNLLVYVMDSVWHRDGNVVGFNVEAMVLVVHRR